MCRCGCAPPEGPGESGGQRTKGFRVDQTPPCLLNLCLALQQVLVQSSLPVLMLGLLQQHLWLQEGDRERILASAFFHSSISTLLQTCLGTRLPLIQGPSLEFIIPALVLTSQTSADQHGNCSDYGGSCTKITGYFTQTDTLRELQGMVLTAGLLQLVLGMSGLGGVVLRHCGPLVLAPLLCILGFSIYREAAALCSDHWGVTALAVFIMVLLSQHLYSWFLPARMGESLYPICRMISVLLPLLGVWALCATLEHLGHFRPHLASELLSTLGSQNDSHAFLPANLNASLIQPRTGPDSPHATPWFSFPITGETQLPLLSARGAAAGVAAALSSSMGSQSVYLLTARLLRTPPPPPSACNRGLCAEGIGSVSAALLGGPLGIGSSVANACTLGLSECGSRCTIQLAAAMGLILGLSPRLAQLFTSVPLAIYGAVLCVTYTIAVGTGVAYFQFAHIDSGRNIFNIGFTVFMSLLLPRWFSLHPTFISTGVSSLDVLFQSLLTTPVFLVGIMAFLLDNTVSGSLSERGLSPSTAGRHDRESHQCAGVYDPPSMVRRVLDLPMLRAVPFGACRTPVTKDVERSAQETSDLLTGVGDERSL